MIQAQAKSEVALKIDGLPPEVVAINEEDSTFEVTDGAIVYKVICKTKLLNKLTKNTKKFKYPFIMVIGSKKFSNVDKGMMVLEQAALQVFERIPKEERT